MPALFGSARAAVRRAALARSPRKSVSRPCDAHGLAGWAHVLRQGPNVPAAPQNAAVRYSPSPRIRDSARAPGRSPRMPQTRRLDGPAETGAFARGPGPHSGARPRVAPPPPVRRPDAARFVAGRPRRRPRRTWRMSDGVRAPPLAGQPGRRAPSGTALESHSSSTDRTHPKLMACAFRSAAEHRQNDPTKPAPRAPDGHSTKKSSCSPTQGLISGYAPHGCGRPGRGR
jgi:hypothetical protein